MRKLLAIALLLLPLTACNDGLSETHWEPLWGVPGGGSSGGSAPAPAQPAPGYSNGQPLAPGASKMLQDPEGNLEDNGIEVKASSQTEAENICQDLAALRSDPWTVVQCLGCRLRTTTTGKYICTMRTEVVKSPTEQQP